MSIALAFVFATQAEPMRMAVEIRDGFATVTVTNAPRCILVESSLDLTNWYKEITIAEFGPIGAFSFVCRTNQGVFWRVTETGCCW